MTASLPIRWVAWADRTLRRALPGRCEFCLGRAQPAMPWCEPCLLSLPWNLPACPVCAEPMATGVGSRICGRCLRRPPGFRRAHVALRYEDEVASLLQRFKYSASPRAGAVLLALLLRQCESLHPFPEGLVGVPLHPRRAKERGFDQVGWLTTRLSRALGVPRFRARRVRETASQVGLGRKARHANLRGAFAIEDKLPARLLLIDDIMTTGATFEALAQACRRGGAHEIEVLAVARTPLL